MGGGFLGNEFPPPTTQEKAMCKEFSLYSLNSQHSVTAIVNLGELLSNRDGFCLFLQEPYLHRSHVADFQGLTPMYADSTNLRAAIVCARTWTCSSVQNIWGGAFVHHYGSPVLRKVIVGSSWSQ